MSDLVDRLLAQAVVTAAVDEIERLRRVIEQMRDALKEWAVEEGERDAEGYSAVRYPKQVVDALVAAEEALKR